MTTALRPDVLTAQELQRRARLVEPGALLVPPRILRRVIKTHRRLGGFGLRVPHHKSYTLDRESLLRIATPEELGLSANEALPDRLFLYPRPVVPCPPDERLVTYWRLLFHSGVHVALDARHLDAAAVRQRIDTLGVVAFEEARAVLAQENFLFDPHDDAHVYAEFAAVYLELLHFDPHRLPQYFPAVRDPAAVEAMLSQDVDADRLFHDTRLEGAPDPVSVLPTEPPPPTEPIAPEETTTAPGAVRVKAEHVSRLGNQVRAALLLQRAIAVCPPTQAGGLRAGARAQLEALVGRLGVALQLPAEERAIWLDCLVELLPAAAAARMWTLEARLLYDLQKACIDVERPLFAADLVEWAVSFFQRPIKRPLPDQQLVLVVKHLRSALARVPAARLAAEARQKLGELLRAAVAGAERRMRQTFQPKLLAALDKVGLVPADAAESLSRNQLVEELLDTICTRGTISLGDLRDAVARSRVKLPDVSPVELLTGDELLRANRELAVSMDGVYRRGEIYLRWLQTLGSLFFGTFFGRLITLYLILPLLGSLLLLKGTDEIFHLCHTYLGGPAVDIEHPYTAFGLRERFGGSGGEVTAADLEMERLYTYLGVAAFLLPVMHVPAFRHLVGRALWHLWLPVRFLCYDLPIGLFNLPLVRAFLQSRPYLLFWHFLGKPLLWTLPGTALLYLFGVPWSWNLGISTCLLLTASVLGNTRLGLSFEETTTDWLARTWQLIREDLLPGVFGWIMWFSRYVFDRIERGMYAVDEMLRFRQGESAASFVLKVAFGLIWWLLTYAFRLVYNVFFEPQVNPIKHFPVVTVAHKLTLPLILPMSTAVADQLGWRVSDAVALLTPVQMATPGMWGFLAWELKENWRLYRANQDPRLTPAQVGSHGEEIIHFIRPGFHSGTLPKLFARLRRAKGKRERRNEEALHHVEAELRHFVGRELLSLLPASKRWPASAAVSVGHVDLATNRIRITLECPALVGDVCRLDFTNRGGYLVARVEGPGWLAHLDDGGRAVFVAALTGFYKRAGVDLVGNHLEALSPPGATYTIIDDQLRVVGPGGETVHDLTQPDVAGRLLFRDVNVSWQTWAAHWQAEAAGAAVSPLVPGVRMLPEG